MKIPNKMGKFENFHDRCKKEEDKYSNQLYLSDELLKAEHYEMDYGEIDVLANGGDFDFIDKKLHHLDMENKLPNKQSKQNTLKDKKAELNKIKRFGVNMNNSSYKESWNSSSTSSSSNSDNYQSAKVYPVAKQHKKGSVRPKQKRLQWSNENMEIAMREVRNDENTMRGASKKYNVPYSTLKDRIKNKIQHGTRPGVKTLVCTTDEQRLVKIINYLEDCGFDTYVDIKEKAHEFIILNPKKGNQTKDKSIEIPGHNWLTGFLNRHQECKTNKSYKGVTANDRLNHFYEMTSRAYDYIPESERANSIYSVGYVNFPSFPGISLIVASSVDGSMLPPYVYGEFELNALQVMNRIYPSAKFESTLSNSSDKEHLFEWLNLFLTQTESQSSYEGKMRIIFQNVPINNISNKCVEKLIEKGIHLINIPPHPTKNLHPIDSTFVNNIDKYARKYLAYLQSERNMFDSSTTQIDPTLLAKVLKKVFERNEEIRSRMEDNYKQTGIYPFKHYTINKKFTGRMNYQSLFSNDFDPSFGLSSKYPSYKDLPAFGSQSVYSLPNLQNSIMQENEWKPPPKSRQGNKENDTKRLSKLQKSIHGDTTISSVESLPPNTINKPIPFHDVVSIDNFHNPDVISKALASIAPDLLYGNDVNNILGDENLSLDENIDDFNHQSTFLLNQVKEENIETEIVDMFEHGTDFSTFVNQEVTEEPQELLEEIITDDVSTYYNEVASNYICDSEMAKDAMEEINNNQCTNESTTCPTSETIESDRYNTTSTKPDDSNLMTDYSIATVSDDHLPHNDETIILEGKQFNANQKVHLAIKFVINNHPVETASNMTLKEASSLIQKHDNILECRITLV